MLLVWTVVSLWGLWLLVTDRMAVLRFRALPGRDVPLWRGVDIVLAFIVYFLVLWTLAAWRYSADLGGVPGAADATLVQAGGIGAAVAFVFLTVVRTYGQPLSALGLRRTSWWSVAATLAFFVLGYAPLLVLVAAWYSGLEVFLGLEHDEQAPVRMFRDSLRAGDPVAVGILLGGGLVIAPVFEEILFRGFLYGLARARWGRGPAMVVASLVFALPHPPVHSMVPIFFVGLILCYIYERTSSLYPAMLFHAVFNGVSFLGLVVASEGAAQPP